MTTLLASTTATGAAATEGDVKTYLANLRTFMADLLGTDSANKAAVQGFLGNILNGKLTKTGSYTVVADDRGKVIDCTGTWTLSVAAAATLGDGFVFAVRNSGTGVITIDPSLTETVNGQTVFPVGLGGFYLIYCDGVGFSIVGASSAKGIQVFSSPGTFTIPAGVTSLKLTIVGGGGGGGSGSSQYGGGGGGGGGYSISQLSGLTPGLTISVSAVGSGGAGGSGGNGADGGTTSVSSGTQAIPGMSATGGGGGKSTSFGSAGGAGGIGTGGSVNGGGGGGGGGSGVAQTCSGAGGSSLLGGGGNSAGYLPSIGGSGMAYGGGGGGGYGLSGGSGSAGVVIFEW